MDLTNKEGLLDVWYEVYVRGSYSDPHTVFAERINLSSRNQAKQLCYQIAYPIFNCKVIQSYVKGE